MIENRNLDTYWISFPKNPHLPLGLGVTAFSVADAFQLIEQQQIGEWFADAIEINIKKGVRADDLEARHVSPNCGPMQFRGVWYPAMNIGYGAPSDTGFTRLLAGGDK